MIKPLTPPDEQERLSALLRLNLLDTPPESRFDRITRLAAETFQVPYATVTLVDADRQWFKSRQGLSISQTPRDESFCAHAILRDEPLIVPETQEDARFCKHPAVVGGLGVRFYAGFPLSTSDGYRVGTLAIIDTRPRTLSPEELQSLQDMAAIVEGELERFALQDALRRVEAANAERDEMREKFEAFMENTPCIVFIKDAESRMQYINRRFEEAFQTGIDELRGKDDFDWLPADAAARTVENDRRVLETNTVVEVVEPVPGPSGEMRDWLCLKFPIPQPSGTSHLGGVGIDVTDHRKAHDALQQSTALQQAVLDSVDACIVATDLQGRILKMNSPGGRMLGYAEGELVGVETPLCFLEPMELDAYVADLSGASVPVSDRFEALVHRARAGDADERTWTCVRKDGSRFPVRLRVTALRNEAGEVDGFLAVARDITRDKQAERAMIDAKEAAEQASETKSRFLANISHEIRTPLNGILGVNTVLLEAELTTEQKRLAGIVQESAESLLNIVDDILDFSKVEAGLIELEESPFQLSTLFAQVERLYGVRASARGLLLETRISADIPDWLVGDASRVRQVINNFVSNATKFSERGKITISATAESFDTKGRVWVRICVQDFGIGVPPEAQQWIFDPFSQADGSTTRRYGGTGLGLSICRQLVQLMGGEIGVESAVGQGSTFWFTVRLRTATADESAPEEADPRDAIQLPGLRVLVAEDSNVNQLVILHELHRLGCTPVAVSNGREAVRAVSQGGYDLVLMDCQMPEMDGYEAAREIRRLPCHGAELPIVAITANAMKGERERCLAAGMTSYLSKPFSRTQFREIVIGALPPGFMVGAAAEEPALGHEELDALRAEAAEMGGELLQRLVEAFGQEAAEALGALTAAAATLNAERILGAAHKLKGSGSNFGARPLCRLCERIEDLARNGHVTEAITLIPDLQKEATRAIESLAAILPSTETIAVPTMS